MNPKTNKSRQIALCGIFSALAVAPLYFSFISLGTYALPALSGVILAAVMLEIDGKYAFLSYAAVSLLALFTVPNAEVKLMFVMFFGYYPSLKLFLDRKLGNRSLWSVLIKLVIFNASMILAYLLLFYIFGLSAESFELFGRNLPFVFLLFGNLVFVVYEVFLERFYAVYMRVIRPKIHKFIRF